MVRPRFSLRTLLLAMGVAAAAFALVGNQIRDVAARREFFSEAGLRPYYYGGLLPEAVRCRYYPPRWHNEWFATITIVRSWPDCKATDEHLRHLSGFEELHTIQVSSEKVTDVGLLELATLTNLRHVRIESPRITAEGEQWLRAALPDCKIEIVRAP